MDIYTEDERCYHMSLIEDMIELYENRKDKLGYTFEEHVDLLINYNDHVHELDGIADIVSIERYQQLYDESAVISQHLLEGYQKHGELNFNEYYHFCKTVEEMMSIIVNETGKDESDIADIFAKMTM